MRKKQVFPVSSFDICLSNRCNLMCRYCYFDSINRGAPEFLDFRDIRRAVDSYVDLVSARGIDKISVAGGEPFLDFPLLLKTVRYIRRACGPRTDIAVFTNGTLAYPERLRSLMGCGAKIVLSIDGRRGANDLNRVFASGKGSVYSAVMKNFSGLSREERSRVCASMTVTASTAASLPDNVRSLREAGFGEVQINLNLLEIWPPADIAALKRSVARLRAYYADLFRGTARSFSGFRFGLEYILLKWDESLEASGVFKEISVAPDGNFYPCGIVSTYGPQKRPFSVGTLKAGLDAPRMRAMRARAVREIRAADKGVGLLEYLPNPMLLYFEARLKGVKLRSIFSNARRLFKIFYDEMSPLLRMERMLDIMSSDPRFGDFPHEPRAKSAGEVSSLEVDLGRRRGAGHACPCGKGRVGFPGLAEQREPLDLLLYSPGAYKFLTVGSLTPGRDFELAGLLAMYAGMKGRALGKKVRARFHMDPRGLGPEEREFMEAAGIGLSAELEFSPASFAGSFRKLKSLVAGGARIIRLLPRGNASQTELRRSAKGFFSLMTASSGGPGWFVLENAERQVLSPSGREAVSGRDGSLRAAGIAVRLRSGEVGFSLPPRAQDPLERELRAVLLDNLRDPSAAKKIKALLGRL